MLDFIWISPISLFMSFLFHDPIKTAPQSPLLCDSVCLALLFITLTISKSAGQEFWKLFLIWVCPLCPSRSEQGCGFSLGTPQRPSALRSCHRRESHTKGTLLPMPTLITWLKKRLPGFSTGKLLLFASLTLFFGSYKSSTPLGGSG